MNQIAMQLESTVLTSVGPGENVIFDKEVLISGGISYDSVTGEITFLEAGLYLVNWSVNVQSVSGPMSPVFKLATDNGKEYIGNSILKTNEVIGFSVVKATECMKLSLANNLGAIVYLAQTTDIKANLIITVAGALPDEKAYGYYFSPAEPGGYVVLDGPKIVFEGFVMTTNLPLILRASLAVEKIS